jgi:hypothetical protein
MIELDHFFVFTAPNGGALRRHLADVGLTETYERAHPGQGTANVCYAFNNAYLELLWLTDAGEARSETIRRTGLYERSQRAGGVCPFGVAYRLSKGQSAPFDTWPYSPPYLPEGMTIQMATYSDDLRLPLVFESPHSVAPSHWPPDRQRGLQQQAGFQRMALRLTPGPSDLPEGLTALREHRVIRLMAPEAAWNAELETVDSQGKVHLIALA